MELVPAPPDSERSTSRFSVIGFGHHDLLDIQGVSDSDHLGVFRLDITDGIECHIKNFSVRVGVKRIDPRFGIVSFDAVNIGRFEVGLVHKF